MVYFWSRYDLFFIICSLNKHDHNVGTPKRHGLVKRISHVPRYFSFYEEYAQMCAIRGIKALGFTIDGILVVQWC